jgi:DNA-binding transcriptional regulator YhcF (GntR family)
MSPTNRPDPAARVADVANRIKDRIFSSLHLGRVQHGDRLPSIRQMAEQLDVDHRIVARAYQRLENEGLVEIRGRSGIYLIEPRSVGRGVLAATAEWVAVVLAEAWSRQIGLPDFAALVTHCTGAGVKCACIDSVEDHTVAFCAELNEDFGLHTRTCQLKRDESGDVQNEPELKETLEWCDFVATTAFVSNDVRRMADAIERPTVVITVHPEMLRIVEAAFAKGPVGVVVADPGYGERLKLHFGQLASGEDHVHVLLADEYDAATTSQSPRVFMTRAARRKLGHIDYELLPPPPPFISPTTAKEVSQLIVQFTLAGMERALPGAPGGAEPRPA